MVEGLVVGEALVAIERGAVVEVEVEVVVLGEALDAAVVR
jgi:hypothetical protein